MVFSGSSLMNGGIGLPFQDGDAYAWQFEINLV
jgi:hypothetical protein